MDVRASLTICPRMETVRPWYAWRLTRDITARWTLPVSVLAVSSGGQARYMKVAVDASASEEQREAVLKIASGEDTDAGKTIFNVFASTYEQVFDPVFADIDFEVDVDSRKGHIRVEGLIETTGKPIVNPVTGDEHRARIDIPDGFEYRIAEIGSASSTTYGNIELRLENTYGQFANIHLNNHGVVHA